MEEVCHRECWDRVRIKGSWRLKLRMKSIIRTGRKLLRSQGERVVRDQVRVDSP